jgi:hypothetical protein
MKSLAGLLSQVAAPGKKTRLADKKTVLGPPEWKGAGRGAQLGTGISALGQESEAGSVPGLLEQMLNKLDLLSDIGDAFKHKFLLVTGEALTKGLVTGKTTEELGKSIEQHIIAPLREQGVTMDGRFWEELGHVLGALRGLMALAG